MIDVEDEECLLCDWVQRGRPNRQLTPSEQQELIEAQSRFRQQLSVASSEEREEYDAVGVTDEELNIKLQLLRVFADLKHSSRRSRLHLWEEAFELEEGLRRLIRQRAELASDDDRQEPNASAS